MSTPGSAARMPGRPDDPHGVPPLGQILLSHGWIAPEALDGVLAAQGRGADGRFGELAVARGAARDVHVGTALAEQWGLGYIDLDRHPPDPGLAPSRPDVDVCLRHRILPWSRAGRMTSFVTDRPERAAGGMAALSDPAPMGLVSVVTRRQMDRALGRALGPDLARRAAEAVPRESSVRGLRPARTLALALLIAGIAAWVAGGPAVVAALWGLALAAHLATLGLRTLALAAGARPAGPEEESGSGGSVRLADHRPRPTVSILVPLYREAGMAGGLIEALSAIDYPRELLDVLLLVEEEDRATREALENLDLPAWMGVLIVPDGQPRTKPRALNHALAFCRGEVIGILDAEDRPDPGQVERVVARLADAPRETVAVQCQLAWYNAAENWLSRCFQLEYAIWFEVLLRGYRRLGLPLPLGGTSVYLRAAALRELGGWDAHNVTEDADLGLRLARRGWRCDVIRSTTEEEAVCRLAGWIRQRSRWTKGYVLTWMSHMRDPLSLWRDLGPKNFLAVQVIFLGGIATYLTMPLFWASLIAWAVMDDALWPRWVPEPLIAPVGASLVLGWVVMLAAAALAMARRRQMRFLAWAPTLPVYWWLGAIAAWKAMAEVITAPDWWDKTEHGLSRIRPPAALPRRELKEDAGGAQSSG